MKLKKWNFFRLFAFSIGMIMLFWFLLPISGGIINIGNTVGIVLTALLAGIAAFWEPFKLLISSLWKNILVRIFIILISLVLSFSIICGLILTGFMIDSATKTPPQNTTVIVLGCKVKGITPSIMLKKRLNAAYEYLQANPNSKCIVSGGKGPKEDIPEAQAMYDYLVDKGISPDRIYQENASADTEENIKFSKKIIDQNNLGNKAVIATDGFHQMRAGMIAKKDGLTPYAVSSATEWYLFPTYYVRELFGLMEQIVLK